MNDGQEHKQQLRSITRARGSMTEGWGPTTTTTTTTTTSLNHHPHVVPLRMPETEL
jgi:hypothetical protein